MKADVVIVGGGLMGFSTALHLALRGSRCVVLEKDSPGRHASGVNARGLRQLNRPPSETPISVAAAEVWTNVGTDLEEALVARIVDKIDDGGARLDAAARSDARDGDDPGGGFGACGCQAGAPRRARGSVTSMRWPGWMTSPVRPLSRRRRSTEVPKVRAMRVRRNARISLAWKRRTRTPAPMESATPAPASRHISQRVGYCV